LQCVDRRVTYAIASHLAVRAASMDPLRYIFNRYIRVRYSSEEEEGLSRRWSGRVYAQTGVKIASPCQAAGGAVGCNDPTKPRASRRWTKRRRTACRSRASK